MKATCILLFFLSSLCMHVKAADTTSVTMKIHNIPLIPPAAGKSLQHGVAGAVIGISGNRLIVAGGSNFEDNLPWRGGTKMYHDEVFLFRQKRNGEKVWSQSKINLPIAMAYGACVSLPNGILSIGGEDKNGPIKKVFLFTYKRNKLLVKSLPDLPVAITSAGAAVIGNTVFVTGGLNAKGLAVAECFCMDLSTKSPSWKSIAALPQALSHGVVAAQSDGIEQCIYLVGGRFRNGEVSTFLNTVLKYSPSKNVWEKVAEIKLANNDTFGLSAGTGVAFRDKYIVLFGGDKGLIFNPTERINNTLATLPDGKEKQALLKQKDELLSNHPGLYRDVLVFNTLTKHWEITGEIPGRVQVTTTAVWWHHKVYIPSGEIKPGIRTDEVLEIELEENGK